MNNTNEEWMKNLQESREKTQKEFDKLCIIRFTEMVEESSCPSMFENLENDLEQLLKTRGLV